MSEILILVVLCGDFLVFFTGLFHNPAQNHVPWCFRYLTVASFKD